jgi:hypothetical protein
MTQGLVSKGFGKLSHLFDSVFVLKTLQADPGFERGVGQGHGLVIPS